MVSHENLERVAPWHDGQFVGGHPALDFANTISDRVETNDAVDRLRTADDLGTWLLSAGLATPEQAEVTSRIAVPPDAWLAPIRALRETAWSLLCAVAESRPADPATLGVVLSAANASLATLRPIDRPASARLTDPFPEDPVAIRDSLLSLLALQILDAYFTLPRARFRSCPRCGWLFHDRSRGGRRRWCRMETCGNREKAKRHYRRDRVH